MKTLKSLLFAASLIIALGTFTSCTDDQDLQLNERTIDVKNIDKEEIKESDI